MDASSRRILGLMSEMNVRFVVPVYQRPYSWGLAQCAQLWDDILRTGRVRDIPHFTGSIVTIQDGSVSREGVASLLLIDGQQRLTTISLLLIALAEYAATHETSSFTYHEVADGGFLTNRFRDGDDHYKLMLSKGDRESYRALVSALEAGEPLPDLGSSRLAENLAFFEQRVEAIDDIDSVWAGLQRLEVVSIALAQGQDDPQVIFESMNSTGKDLSSADLVRNFVLMGYPVAEQQDMYNTYWRPIEEVLGEGSYDEAFDDFVRCYLAVEHAPETFSSGDAYPALKRHILSRGFSMGDRMKVFCLRLKRFAGYYAQVRGVRAEEGELAQRLWRIAQLDGAVVTPLLMGLFDARERAVITEEELVRLMDVLEAYLLRRAVCDCPPSEMAPMVASLLARLQAVREEEGDVATAFVAMLLNEDGGARRMPGDAEFAYTLTTRDAASLGCVRYLFARLEGGAMEQRLVREAWTVEHVMPVRAPHVASWRELLGEEPERTFEGCVNRLGNLTLTDAAFDLQDADFRHKCERIAATDGGAVLAVSESILAAPVWDEDAIDERTGGLVAQALATWPVPELDEAARQAYRASERAAATRQVSFAELFEAGLVEMDDILVSANLMYAGRATVTSTGKIMLANGEMFDDPTAAYERFLGAMGATASGLNGWLYWRRGEGGPTLDELRASLGHGKRA